MRLALDHLVLAARTLAEGVDWCEATLGIRPDAGGQHVFMGTHNRVFGIASAGFPRAYFEVIATDPALPAPGRARWFDLDEAALQRSLAQGPQLVHWVARCDAIDLATAAMRAGGVDCGEPHRAERATPGGVLRWQISLRADGHRPLAGAAPALIEWGDTHPVDSLAGSGVTLESMAVAGWPDALGGMLPANIGRDAMPSAPPLSVALSSPRGRVTLNSIRLES
jgi:catechol 2,3-dioxygenase-like lactoylglutathione lyase family enzyme